MLSKKLLPVLLICALSACNTPGANVRQQIQLPAWYSNPSAPGYIGVTASAKPQSMGGIEAQRRVAIMLARAEMSRIKNVQVKSNSLTTITSSGSAIKLSNEDMRTLTSVQMLQLGNVVIRDEWIHPETKELFLWLVYPVSK